MKTALETESPPRSSTVVPTRASDEPALELTPRERTQRRVALLIVLSIASALRLWGLLHDLPFSYFGDELHFVKRAMAMGTGDLNPHWFNKPAFLMYVLLFVYGLYYLFGRAIGWFASVEEYGAAFLADLGPFLLLGRLVVCLAGIAIVYLVWLIGLEVYRRWQPAFLAALATAVMPPMVTASQDDTVGHPVCFLLGARFLLLSPLTLFGSTIAPGGGGAGGGSLDGNQVLRHRAGADLRSLGNLARLPGRARVAAPAHTAGDHWPRFRARLLRQLAL